MSRFKLLRVISVLLLSVLSILVISTEVWAGPSTAWWQVRLDITLDACMTRSFNALRAAGYSDIQRETRSVVASDGPVSAWLICYSLTTQSTLLTIFTAGDNYDDMLRMRNRLRDFVQAGQ